MTWAPAGQAAAGAATVDMPVVAAVHPLAVVGHMCDGMAANAIRNVRDMGTAVATTTKSVSARRLHRRHRRRLHHRRKFPRIATSKLSTTQHRPRSPNSLSVEISSLAVKGGVAVQSISWITQACPSPRKTHSRLKGAQSSKRRWISARCARAPETKIAGKAKKEHAALCPAVDMEFREQLLLVAVRFCGIQAMATNMCSGT